MPTLGRIAELCSSAQSVKIACPPARRHRIPERFRLCVTSVLQAASTTAGTDRQMTGLGVGVAHAVAVAPEVAQHLGRCAFLRGNRLR